LLFDCHDADGWMFERLHDRLINPAEVGLEAAFKAGQEADE
jgi:hypothetical protein